MFVKLFVPLFLWTLFLWFAPLSFASFSFVLITFDHFSRSISIFVNVSLSVCRNLRPVRNFGICRSISVLCPVRSTSRNALYLLFGNIDESTLKGEQQERKMIRTNWLQLTSLSCSTPSGALSQVKRRPRASSSAAVATVESRPAALTMAWIVEVVRASASWPKVPFPLHVWSPSTPTEGYAWGSFEFALQCGEKREVARLKKVSG